MAKNIKSKKTLLALFKTPEAWWEKAKSYLHLASEKEEGIITAFFWENTLFNYLKHTVLAGKTADTVEKILTDSALDFISLKRKDDIWNKIYPRLEELFEEFETQTREDDEFWNKEARNNYGKKKEDTKTTPLLGLSSDKVQGVNWGEVSKTLLEGFYADGKFNPNVENQNREGWNVKTTTTQHQKQQQIGRIIQAVLAVDVDLTPLLEKYYEKYAWKWTSPFGGSMNIDYSTGSLRFDITPEQFEDEVDPLTGKELIQVKTDPDSDDISFEQWQAKREKGEAVELSWDLECWARYKRRLENELETKTGGSLDIDMRRIKALDGLMDTFSREIYIPPLTHYDKVMSEITGFKNFKKELRDQLELAYRYRQIGEKQPQIFYSMLGKPGVGKSEISQRLAKALNRPIVILSMGGATSTRPLEGEEASYKGTGWSDILETFIGKRSEQVVKLSETEEELKMYQDLKIKTKFQEKKINELKKIIEIMNKDGITEMKMDLPCKAPIILLDELEKVDNLSVLDAAGKILDAKLNWSHFDKFLEFRINLSYCLILATMNDRHRAPGFIKDRCKFVDIELLKYSERLEILEGIATDMIRQYFPVIKNNKVDRAEQKRLKEQKILSTRQQHVRDMIGNKTMESCLTQSWGVRGAIMNMIKVVNFLMLIDIRKESKEQLTKTSYTSFFNSGNLDNYDWDSDRDGHDGFGKEGDEKSSQVRRLRYNKLDPVEELVLTKKLDEDKIEKEEDKNWKRIETVLNQVIDWPGYSAVADEFSSSEYDISDPSVLSQKNKELEKELWKAKQQYQQDINKKDTLNESQRKELTQALDEVHRAGLDKKWLTESVEALEKKLTQMGVEHEKLKTEAIDASQNLPVLVVKNIPQFAFKTNFDEERKEHIEKLNSTYTLGKNSFEKNDVRIFRFDKDEALKIKKLIVSDCPNIIQLDLKNLTNLEKLTLRKSKWDSIKNAQECTNLKKVSVKDCQDVSLEFLNGTNVEEVKVI